jgi:hypothetical protein
MYNRFEDDNPPLCRFGPGGDFTSDWLTQSAGHAPSSNNRLNKILASLNEIIAAMLGAELDDHAVKNEKYQLEAKRIIFPNGELKHADKNIDPDKTPDPATVPTVNDGSSLPDQQMLFPDDGGDSRRAPNKPKYRIRTYRKASKKKALVSFFGQGSLFDDNLKSARTA